MRGGCGGLGRAPGLAGCPSLVRARSVLANHGRICVESKTLLPDEMRKTLWAFSSAFGKEMVAQPFGGCWGPCARLI